MYTPGSDGPKRGARPTPERHAGPPENADGARRPVGTGGRGRLPERGEKALSALIEGFRHQVPGYMLRHKVKAGITGWAQVHGWRGDTSLEKRIEFDLYYIQNWTLSLDLKIVWMTLWTGFVHENAH